MHALYALRTVKNASSQLLRARPAHQPQGRAWGRGYGLGVPGDGVLSELQTTYGVSSKCGGRRRVDRDRGAMPSFGQLFLSRW